MKPTFVALPSLTNHSTFYECLRGILCQPQDSPHSPLMKLGVIISYSICLERRITSPSTYIIRWNITTESTLKKLIYSTSSNSTTFQFGIASFIFGVKEFEGDVRSIIFKLHHYHTKSNVAQHDIITLTTDITNLTFNDSWKGRVRQFCSHCKEKLRLLDSFVPVSDQLPETTRITFLQRAVHQNHDLRQIHVMDSVWRSKTDSTDALTFDTYYNLLWDAAHQYDLHQIKKGPQRKAFSSHKEEISDDDEYANAGDQFSTDSEPEEHSPYSVYQSSFHPKMPQTSFLPPHIWETLS